jgi:hypothetical protein
VSHGAIAVPYGGSGTVAGTLIEGNSATTFSGGGISDGDVPPTRRQRRAAARQRDAAQQQLPLERLPAASSLVFCCGGRPNLFWKWARE